MKFAELSSYLNRLEKISSRNEITEVLADLFSKSDKKEIDKTVYLILGKLAPSYKGIVFNMADQMVVSSIAKAFKKEMRDVKKLYKEIGDLGEVAYKLSEVNGQGISQQSIDDVYGELVKIAMYEGEGSVERKSDGLAKLMQNLDSKSAKYIVRIPLGKLRLGFSDKTILDALSFAEFGDKSASKKLKNAYDVLPDVGYLAKLAKEKGIEEMTKNIKPEIGIPVAPMLAQRLKSADEMVKKMGKVAVEPKFDGLRMLIHYRKKDKFIRAFTRNLNFIDTSVFPELVELKDFVYCDEIILDTEAIGMDPDRQFLVDFQKTMNRRRVHNVDESAKNTPFQFQVFDCVYVDGESLLNKTYLERRLILEKCIKSSKQGLLRIDEYTVTDNPEIIRTIHKKYIDDGLEGVIVKKVDGKYVSGRTGWNWVKMKESEGDYAKLADTLDCIVMGYSVGKGKRTGFGVGQFLVGVIKDDEILTVSKVGTGLTDDQFKELFRRLEILRTDTKPRQYKLHKDLEPDFWVEPKLVVELAADEITKSPKHSAGYALRFPRLIRFRDDKSPNQATNYKEIKELVKLCT